MLLRGPLEIYGNRKRAAERCQQGQVCGANTDGCRSHNDCLWLESQRKQDLSGAVGPIPRTLHDSPLQRNLSQASSFRRLNHVIKKINEFVQTGKQIAESKPTHAGDTMALFRHYTERLPGGRGSAGGAIIARLGQHSCPRGAACLGERPAQCSG